jgi:glycine/D-amino acid oxidase-like deaminating enzyme
MTFATRTVVVIGGGVLGSAVASHIEACGHTVTLITDEPRGTTRVSTASLAWVNANSSSPDAYSSLRSDARTVHARVGVDAGWFRPTGSTTDGVAAPGDGYVDTERFIAVHRSTLLSAGGTVRAGMRVRNLRRHGQRVVVVCDGAANPAEAPIEQIVADTVVIAAGTGTAQLASSIGADTRRLGTATGPRGFLARIRLDHGITHVRSANGLQLRPDGAGVLAAQSLTIERQLLERGDDATVATVWPALRAELGSVLGRDVPEDALIRLDEASRPMSADGLPVVGWVADGVYALLSHSGVTLAPLLAELVARDLSGDADPRLDPYRPNCRIGSTP